LGGSRGKTGRIRIFDNKANKGGESVEQLSLPFTFSHPDEEKDAEAARRERLKKKLYHLLGDPRRFAEKYLDWEATNEDAEMPEDLRQFALEHLRMLEELAVEGGLNIEYWKKEVQDSGYQPRPLKRHP